MLVSQRERERGIESQRTLCAREQAQLFGLVVGGRRRLGWRQRRPLPPDVAVFAVSP